MQTITRGQAEETGYKRLRCICEMAATSVQIERAKMLNARMHSRALAEEFRWSRLQSRFCCATYALPYGER
jgi:hypothetical protein